MLYHDILMSFKFRQPESSLGLYGEIMKKQKVSQTIAIQKLVVRAKKIYMLPA
jgi:hypothetical protein